jgi:hypothetical protein
MSSVDVFTGEQVEAMCASAVARAVLAERERIAQEIEACLPTPCRDLGRGCACSLCYETHAYRDAARIARGQA